MSWEVLEGDCRELMKKLGDASIDAVVTDPPYSIGFMNRSWDKTGIPYQVSLWEEVLRVLKPGGYVLAAGGSRTHHRLACAIEDAGFEPRDTVVHCFGSGFPKSLAIDKAIDRAAGAEREVVSQQRQQREGQHSGGGYVSTLGGCGGNRRGVYKQEGEHFNITAPATEAAKKWAGFGTALKPAAEFWTLARKPIEGTVAQNVIKHGTGALNIDGCRIPGAEGDGHWSQDDESDLASLPGYDSGFTRGGTEHEKGRWPTNFVMSHSESCGDECAPECPVAEMDRQSGCLKSGDWPEKRNTDKFKNIYGKFEGQEMGGRNSNEGGASRFFPCFRYEAKAGRRERDEGLADLPIRTGGELTGRKEGTAGLNSPRAGAGRTSGGRNLHPTVKPIAFMRWLVRLVTPPGGLVLDQFTGSGSTGCAAVAEGFRFIGMEKDHESVDIARRRIEYWAGLGHQMDLFG